MDRSCQACSASCRRHCCVKLAMPWCVAADWFVAHGPASPMPQTVSVDACICEHARAPGTSGYATLGSGSCALCDDSAIQDEACWWDGFSCILRCLHQAVTALSPSQSPSVPRTCCADHPNRRHADGQSAGNSQLALLKVLRASPDLLLLTLQERCGRFRKWLQNQPQKVIVVVGHSTFFKAFTSSPHRLKNCEIKSILI